MTIDINELRKDKRPQSSTVVHALLDRLEAAEKEREIDEQRIADLMAELNRVGHENDALRAKVERMTKRLRLILEEPENTMSNSKAMREMIRQARLALEESK